MSIQKLSQNELQVVQDLAYATWPETFKEILTKEQIDYMLEWMYNLETLKNQVKDGHQFYLYSENEIPLGFIGFESFQPFKNVIKIHKLYVLPQTQGSGVGKKLIQKTVEIAKETGVFSIVLNVNRFNKAVSFYQYLGFQIIFEENIDIGNGYLMEDYVLELEV